MVSAVPSVAIVPVPKERRTGFIVNEKYATKSQSRNPLKRQAYLGLFLVFLPLAFHLLLNSNSTESRFRSTLDRYPQVAQKIGGEVPRHDNLVFDALPGNRIDGAWLSRYSLLPLLLGLFAFLTALLLVGSLFEWGGATIGSFLGAALFSAAACVLLLFAIFYISLLMLAIVIVCGVYLRIVRGPDGGKTILVAFTLVAVMLLYIFFGMRAFSPSFGFLASLGMFVFGVGLCEELLKATPLLARMDDAHDLDWRGLCLLGLASGVGFGAAESVLLSMTLLNGIASSDSYLASFISCIGFHAVISGGVGIAIYKHSNTLMDDNAIDYMAGILNSLSVPILLHGLYDTLVKFEWNAVALAVVIATALLLIWQIESARRNERQVTALKVASPP